MFYESGSILAALREHDGAENPSTSASNRPGGAGVKFRIEKFALIGANWRRWRHRQKGGCLRRRGGGAAAAPTRGNLYPREAEGESI